MPINYNKKILFQLLYEFIDSFEEGILITDYQGVIIFSNRYFQYCYGYSQSDLLGKLCDFFYASDSIYSSKEPLSVHSYPFMLQCKNGKKIQTRIIKVESRIKIKKLKMYLLRIQSIKSGYIN